MNIAFLLTPKSETTWLYIDYSARQAAEKMRTSGRAAVPVLDREGHYISTISEGDILRFLLDIGDKGRDMSMRTLETYKLHDISHMDKNPPCSINTEINDIIYRAMDQNFIPVVDDSGSYIGIVTRREVLKYLSRYEGRKFPIEKE